MIKSVKFPKTGKGYIYEKPQSPGKAPNKNDYAYWEWDWDTPRIAKDGKISDPKRIFKEEKYNRDYEVWEKDKKFYDEHKGQFTNPAAGNLIGKTFEFEPGKLNIIFGPNGCGKTTILKAIAGTAGIPGDGITKPGDPSDVFGFGLGEEKYSVKEVAKHIEELKKNSAVVDWDGNVVYYDNFAETMKHGYGYIGGLEGTALGSFEQEISFRFNGSKINAGKKAMWLLGNVVEYQKKGITLEKIFDAYVKRDRMNSLWKKSYKAQSEYFQQYENYGKEVPMTFLFDEPEVNFDIMTVWKLYSGVFPKICDEYGTQFITVSHSPLVLADEVAGNEKVNIISIDEEYTKQVKELLNGLKF